MYTCKIFQIFLFALNYKFICYRTVPLGVCQSITCNATVLQLLNPEKIIKVNLNSFFFSLFVQDYPRPVQVTYNQVCAILKEKRDRKRKKFVIQNYKFTFMKYDTFYYHTGIRKTCSSEL